MLGLKFVVCMTFEVLPWSTQIRKVDSEILVAVRQQSSSGSRARSARPPRFLSSIACNAHTLRWLSASCVLGCDAPSDTCICAERCMPKHAKISTHTERNAGCAEHHVLMIAGIQRGATVSKNLDLESSVTRARRQDLTAAKAAIEELFGKIREVRRKAEASEVMVQEICRDIRKLDFAKTHLTHTITALRRLAMLVNAVGESLSLAFSELGPCATPLHLTHPAVLHCGAMPVTALGYSMCSPPRHILLSEHQMQAAAGTCCCLQTLCCT